MFLLLVQMKYFLDLVAQSLAIGRLAMGKTAKMILGPETLSLHASLPRSLRTRRRLLHPHTLAMGRPRNPPRRARFRKRRVL